MLPHDNFDNIRPTGYHDLVGLNMKFAALSIIILVISLFVFPAVATVTNTNDINPACAADHCESNTAGTQCPEQPCCLCASCIVINAITLPYSQPAQPRLVILEFNTACAGYLLTCSIFHPPIPA